MSLKELLEIMKLLLLL